MSSRLNQKRQDRLEPQRIEVAKAAIEKLGLKIIYVDTTRVTFIYGDSPVVFYPYSGWFTGKTIKDGRGLSNLLSQLK